MVERTRPPKLLEGLGITGIATVVTLSLGVVSNKLVALLAGTVGIGLIGIYRNLVSIVIASIQLGAGDVAVQRLSTSRQPERQREVIESVSLLLVLQSAALVLVSLVLSRPVSRWLFGNELAAGHLDAVRLTFVASIGVLALQQVTALLNGQMLVREAARIGMSTSCLTLLSAYPLLHLGEVGLVYLIGGSCFVGAALGFRYVLRENEVTISQLFGAFRRISVQSLPLSASMAIAPVTQTASATAVQAIIGRGYGLDDLGLFNAASLFVMTATTVIGASVRSYYLPALGRFSDPHAKHRFVKLVLSALLVIGLSIGALLLVFRSLALQILFSEKFLSAAPLMAILSLSLVGEVFNWIYAMYFIHTSAYRLRLFLDGSSALMRLGATFYCLHRGWSIEGVAWGQVVCSVLSAGLHIAAATILYGRSMFDRTVFFLTAAIATVFIIGYRLTADTSAWLQQATFLAVVFVLVAVFVRKQAKALRRATDSFA